MKKNLLVMSMMAGLMMAGCGAEPKTETPVEKEPVVQEENGTGAPGMGDLRPEDITTEFGKIKKIVGNEIIVELAKQPGMIDGDEDDLTDAGGSGAIEMPAAGMTPAMEGSQEDGVFVDNGGNKAPKLELEFTGETKTYTIPAGASIMDLKTYTEAQMDSLKQGTVIFVMTDNRTDEGQILTIDILE